jgi:hypothetical protein
MAEQHQCSKHIFILYLLPKLPSVHYCTIVLIIRFKYGKQLFAILNPSPVMLNHSLIMLSPSFVMLSPVVLAQND